MSLLHALRARLRRWPRPGDVEAVRAMTSVQWAGIARRAPSYLQGYADRPGSDDRAQRRAEWLAALPWWANVGSVLELGCAAGRNLACLSRRWPDLRLSGADINEDALALARMDLPGGQFFTLNLYEAEDLTLADPPDVILTVGVLGHLEPTAVPPLLAWARQTARWGLVLLEELADCHAFTSEIVKGPRSWHPEKVTDDYLLYRHPLKRWLRAVGAQPAVTILLPHDLRAPAATTLYVVAR